MRLTHQKEKRQGSNTLTFQNIEASNIDIQNLKYIARYYDATTKD